MYCLRSYNFTDGFEVSSDPKNSSGGVSITQNFDRVWLTIPDVAMIVKAIASEWELSRDETGQFTFVQTKEKKTAHQLFREAIEEVANGVSLHRLDSRKREVLVNILNGEEDLMSACSFIKKAMAQ